MHVPLVDLTAPLAEVRTELDAALARVIDRARFVLGEELDLFEAAFARSIGVRHAVGCGSGSDALLLSLSALGIGPGDQVIVPSFTFIATASAATRLGAEVVFADIEPAGLTIDPASVDAVAERCPRLRAIVPVHLFGRCANSDALRKIATRHGAVLVHDAAQAVGARDERGAAPGSSGELTAFSFYPTKNLGALGEAGLVTTNDDAIAERLRRLRVHGVSEGDRYDEIGFNSRLDELQAAALNVLLPHAEEAVRGRNDVAATYQAGFREAGASALGLRPPPRLADPARHAFHQYVIRVEDGRRDAVAAWLRDRDIETRTYYRTPLHRQRVFAAAARSRGLETPELPETDRAAADTLALPVHPGVAEAQRGHVVESVTGFLSRNGTRLSRPR